MKKAKTHLTNHNKITCFTDVLNQIIVNASYYDARNCADLYNVLNKITQRYAENKQRLKELRNYSEASIKEHILNKLECTRAQRECNIKKIKQLKSESERIQDLIDYLKPLALHTHISIKDAISKIIQNYFDKKYDIECQVEILEEYNKKFETGQINEDCAVDYKADIILLENDISYDRERIKSLKKFITEIEKFKNKNEAKFNNMIKGISNE